MNDDWVLTQTNVDFHIRKVPLDPNAPIAPLPLHLHPPPPRSGSACCITVFADNIHPHHEVIQLRKVSLHLEKSLLTPMLHLLHSLFIFTPLLHQSGHHWMGKRTGLDQRSFSLQTTFSHSFGGIFWKRSEILFGHFFSALNPCVVFHNRKESSDSKPPSQKKMSDHVKKDRSGIRELFSLLFFLEKWLCCCKHAIQVRETEICVFMKSSRKYI